MGFADTTSSADEFCETLPGFSLFFRAIPKVAAFWLQPWALKRNPGEILFFAPASWSAVLCTALELARKRQGLPPPHPAFGHLLPRWGMVQVGERTRLACPAWRLAKPHFPGHGTPQAWFKVNDWPHTAWHGVQPVLRVRHMALRTTHAALLATRLALFTARSASHITQNCWRDVQLEFFLFFSTLKISKTPIKSRFPTIRCRLVEKN